MVKFSVKKPLTVFVAVLAVLVLGVVAYLKMTPDLLPNMDFPYVVIVTTDPGASPEAVESAVTRPMEQSMSTLDRIKSVTSTSQDSVSMVVLEFEDGVNMDTVSVDIQQKINILQGSWDDGVGTPYVLKINPSMLPVQVAAVSYSGKDVTAYCNKNRPSWSATSLVVEPPRMAMRFCSGCGFWASSSLRRRRFLRSSVSVSRG